MRSRGFRSKRNKDGRPAAHRTQSSTHTTTSTSREDQEAYDPTQSKVIFFPAGAAVALCFSLSFCLATQEGCISFLPSPPESFFSPPAAARAGAGENAPPRPPPREANPPRLDGVVVAAPPREEDAAPAEACAPHPPSVPVGTINVPPPLPRPLGPALVDCTNPPLPPLDPLVEL